MRRRWELMLRLVRKGKVEFIGAVDLQVFYFVLFMIEGGSISRRKAWGP